MDGQYLVRDDHIGIFKNFMPDQLIEDYTNYFNKCEQQGAVYPRREDEMLVSDNAIDTIRDTNVAMTYNNKPFIDLFFKEIYPLYVKKYSYLKKLATHNILEVKIQKTKVGTALANETSLSLVSIVSITEETSELVTTIATSSEEQNYSMKQVNEGIKQIAIVTQTNAATAEEGAASSMELASQAEALQSTVDSFKLRN